MKKLTFCVVLLMTFMTVAWPVFGDAPYEQPNTKLYIDNEAEDAILDLLESANQTIDIQMFGMTLYPPIIEALKKAMDNKVKIRIYLDTQGSNNPNKTDKTGFPEPDIETYKPDLQAEIRWDPKTSTLMHRKVAVVDGYKIWIGSTNWTKSGLTKNDEIDVLFENKEVADQILKIFNEDWEKANTEFYSTGKPEEDEEIPCDETITTWYVSSKNSSLYHKPCCKYVTKIKPDNLTTYDSKEKAEQDGKRCCKTCNP